MLGWSIQAVVFALLGGFFSSLALGNSWYVNTAGSDSNSGTQTSPFRTIQKGLNVSQPGDFIRLKGNFNEQANAVRSGTSSAPITIAPDGAFGDATWKWANSSSGGALQITDLDYYTIQDMIFNGGGVEPCAANAIRINASSRSVSGHQIVRSLFKGWGGASYQNLARRAVSAFGVSGSTSVNLSIRQSNFESNRGESIRIGTGLNVLFEDLDFKGQLPASDAADGAIVCVGIKDAQNSRGTIVRRCNFHDWSLKSSISPPTQPAYWAWMGFYADTGPSNGRIENCQFVNIDPSYSAAYGLELESGCSNWTVSNNLFAFCGAGIRNGSTGTGDPKNNQYLNNIIHDVQTGIISYRGPGLILQGNNISKYSNAGLYFGPSAVIQAPFGINGNCYDNQSKVSNWNGSIKSLVQWQAMGNDLSSCGTPSSPVLQTPVIVQQQQQTEPVVLIPTVTGGGSPPNQTQTSYTQTQQPTAPSQDGMGGILVIGGVAVVLALALLE
jgi:hypothetical protein